MKKYLNFNNLTQAVAFVVILLLTIKASFAYIGQPAVYLMFTFVCNLLLYFGFSKNKIYFDTFIGLFFWLGFWLKLTIRAIYHDRFWDPVGSFDYTPASYDRGLIIATVGISGLILARLVREKFVFTFGRIEPQNHLNRVEEFYFKYRRRVLAVFILAVLAVSISNIYFGIYQRGRISNVNFPFFISGSYSWLLFFGFASFTALLVNFELKRNLNPYALVAIGLIESFLTNVSILSRGFILNSTALCIGVFDTCRKKIALNRDIEGRSGQFKFYFFNSTLFIVLFLSSIFSVGYLRSFYYSSEVVEVRNIINIRSKLSDETHKAAIITNLEALIINRWVGMEGVMAVSSFENKGWPLFRQALNEKYAPNGTSFYDKTIATDSPYLTMDETKHHFISIPGLVAFLYYPGSYLFLIFGMFFAGLIATCFEFFIYRFLSGNLILCSLIGQVIAYRYVHFGYVSRQSYLLFGTIVLNLLIFIGLSYFFKKFMQKKSDEVNSTILFAPHIHTGGGLVLLNSVLDKIDFNLTVYVDHRFKINQNLNGKKIRFIKINSNLTSRVWAEYSLYQAAKTAKCVFCFSSLPPLFKLNCAVTVFFQNNILLNHFSGFNFSKLTRLKHMVERFWLRISIKNADRFIVQTPTTKEYFLNEFAHSQVVVAPFINTMGFDQPEVAKEYDFIYVASADPHKNHYVLLEAWEKLAAVSLYPTLVLTLSDQSYELLQEIEKLKSLGLKIINYSNLSHIEVLKLYKKCRTLIFPSLAESFGLPLYEASYLGLSVGASDLKYVYEIVKPSFVFNPQSAQSVANAVQNHLKRPPAERTGGQQSIRIQLLTDVQFIQKYILNS